MKNRIAALSLTLALSVGLCAPAHAAETPFSDVPADHWAASSIAQMAEAGVMTGVGNGQFAPDKTISNAEFIAMIVREFFPDEVGEGGEHWYDPYMEAARSVCYNLSGYGMLADTKVGEDPSLAEVPISRYDMAQIIFRVLREQPRSVPLPDMYEFSQAYPDVVKNHFAVAACYVTGVLTGVDGKGTFNGEGVMTRAQAAVVMDRLCQYKAEIMSNIPTVALDLPEGALMISSRTQFTGGTADGVVDGPGCLYLDPNSVAYGAASFGLITKGYSTITLTFTAADKDAEILATARPIGNSIWTPGESRGSYMVPAGETMTVTFDCSGSEGMRIGLYDANAEAPGVFAEGWITNMYLLP